MAKRFNFDEAITTDIKGAASDSYIDNIKMIKVTDIETNSENFYSLPDIEELAEDIERQGLIVLPLRKHLTEHINLSVDTEDYLR